MTIPELEDGDTLDEDFTLAVAGLQWGSVTVPADAGAATSTATVTFLKPYASNPRFVCNLVSSGGIYCVTAETPGTADIDVTVFRTDGANISASRTVHWIAIGELA